MKNVYRLLFMIFGFSNVFAQIEIKGTITDFNSNLPIYNVTVFIFDLNKSIKSDLNGNFSFIVPGERLLQAEISKEGFESKIVNLLSKEALLITLTKSAVELQEVVITGNIYQHKEKVSYSISSIQNNEILTSGQPSLAASLASIPGISYSSSGPAVTKPVIRGLSNTNIVFLNNGIKLENFQFSNSHPFILDEFSAKKIEVIKGPVSLIYGSDAVGGVINVIKENQATTNTVEANYNFQYHANTDGFVNHIAAKASGNKWFGGVNYSNKTHKDYRDGNGKQVINTRFEEQNFGSNVGYRSNIGTFALYYDFSSPKYGTTNEKSVIIVKNDDRKIDYWFQALENHLVTSKNKLFIGKNIIDIDVAFQKNIRVGVSDTSNPKPEMKFAEMDLQTFTYNTRYTVKKTKKKFVFGANGSSLKNEADEFYQNSNPLLDAKVNDIGFFAINELMLSENLTLNSGLRYDFRKIQSFPDADAGVLKYKIDNDYSSLSGSLGSSYKANNHIFKLNMASGFRSPNVSELTQNGIHQNRYEMGNPDLKAQRNYQMDFTYHYHLKNLVVDFTPFYNLIDQYIYIVETNLAAPLGGGNLFEYVQNDAKLFGGEFVVDYHPFEWLGLHGNYTLTRGKLKKGGNLTQIPQDRLVLEAKFVKEKFGFLINPYVTFNASFSQSQDNLGQLETITPSYNLFNAQLGSELKVGKQNLRLYLSANNIFDEKYIDHLSAFKTLNLNNVGRNFVFGLNIPVNANL